MRVDERNFRSMQAGLLLAVSYFLLVELGLRWATVSGAASPVFPAAGIALAGLLLGGVQLWPAIMIGRLAAAVAAGSPLPLWADLCIAGGNAMAAVLGALWLRRLRIDPSLRRLRDLVPFVGVALAHSAVAATIGAATLALALGQDSGDAALAWANWWIGNGSGVLVVAPLVLSWVRGEPASRSAGWWLNLGTSTAIAAALTWVIFGPLETPLVRNFLVFPILCWAALACGVRGASAAVLVVATMAVWGTTLGYGPLADAATRATEPLRFLMLQQFVIVASLTTLILAVVADERRGREALRESEERLAMALRAGQLGFWDWDMASGRVRFGGEWASMLGYHSREVEGRLDSWQRLIHPDDVERTRQALQDHVEGRTPFYESEHRLRHKDGTWRWMLARGHVVERDASGRAVRAIGTQADITDRKNAEAALRESDRRLRLAGEAAGIGFWTWDLDAQTVMLDSTFAAFFQVEPNVAVPAAEIMRAIHPEDRPRVRAAAIRGMLREDRYDVEFRLLGADGSIRWLAGLGNAVRDGDDGHLRLAGASWEITAKKHAEEERAELLERERAARVDAERASRLKDEFLSTLSHELRTPLNAILGWAQLLLRRVTVRDEGLQQGLAVIDRNARAQVQLVDDLLDMSSVISGRLRLDVQPVDLRDIVTAVLSSLRPSADAKGIRLEMKLESMAGEVRGDPNRLQQVVWNLVSNAVKFTPRDGTVAVRLWPADGQVRISVSDTGQGIAPEFLPFVFDRFRQADASATRTHGGLGLGLAIVKNLVELHGGSVRAESAGIGLGSTFTVELPMRASAKESPGAAPGGAVSNAAVQA